MTAALPPGDAHAVDEQARQLIDLDWGRKHED